MRQENFHASVQYGDFKGTVAADRHDQNDIGEYVRTRGLINQGEFLVGIEAYATELMGKPQVTDVDVTVLVTQFEGYDSAQEAVDSNKPIKVRKIKLEMTVVEFFTLFKRFNLKISSHGLINNRDIVFDD
ncbi:hypothetical protein [Pseudomonas rhizophila]|uniref:hypothetical protein n=1 Tax=Pseudomonas rhizophila TaxID=2045200 RepID=UPI0030DB37C6